MKAKAISSCEGEDYDNNLGDPEELSQDLAMLVRKFQKFSRRGWFGKSSKDDVKKSESSSCNYNKTTCHKCKKSGHYNADCPLREKKLKEKKYNDDSSKDNNKMSSKSSSQKKSSSRKAWELIGKEMDSK